jgi:hypothetical protein
MSLPKKVHLYYCKRIKISPPFYLNWGGYEVKKLIFRRWFIKPVAAGKGYLKIDSTDIFKNGFSGINFID